MILWRNIEIFHFFIILIPTPDFPQFYYMLGGNLGSLLYGDVFVMVVNAAVEEEADDIVTSMDQTRYNPIGFQRQIKIKGQRIKEVKSIKYLGFVISNEGLNLSRIPQTTSAFPILKPMEGQ